MTKGGGFGSAERRERGRKIVSVSKLACRAVTGLERYSIGMAYGNEKAMQVAPLLDFPADLKTADSQGSQSSNLCASATCNTLKAPRAGAFAFLGVRLQLAFI